jgi:hypothetical protein
MKTALCNQSIEQTPAASLATMTVPTMSESVPSTTSLRKTSFRVGMCFLAATFTFAIGNALIHSYFSSAAPHQVILVAGVLLLGCCGLAVVTNGSSMRRILATHTPMASRAYFALRVIECDAYVLAVYAVSGAAGLVLSRAFLTSRIVPRKLSRLGLIGYPVFLVGTILAMFHVVDVTHGVGMLALVPGGLFELILPIWLFTNGFTSHQIEG